MHQRRLRDGEKSLGLTKSWDLRHINSNKSFMAISSFLETTTDAVNFIVTVLNYQLNSSLL